MRAQTNGGSAQLLREIAEDSAILVRKEVQLAKQELLDAVASKAAGAAAFGVAAFFGIIALVFAGHTAAGALMNVVSAWAAYLIVAGVFLVLGLFAATAGAAMIRRRTSPLLPETTKTIKEDIGWARKQLKR